MVTTVDDRTFRSRVLESSTPVLVDFFATWCGPCVTLAPAIEEISREMSDRLTVVKVDVEESPDAVATYGVTAMPTLILFKDGRETWRRVGAAPKRTIADELARTV
jgi:thioredoxin 1